MTATLMTYPLDLIRTRMALQANHPEVPQYFLQDSEQNEPLAGYRFTALLLGPLGISCQPKAWLPSTKELALQSAK